MVRKLPSRVKEDLVSPGRRRGRPSWRPPDLKVVEQLAQRGVTLDQIADLLHINRATFFRKKQASKEFCDAITRGRAKGLLAAANALFELVKTNNLSAIIRMLKKLHWNKWDRAFCPDPDFVAEIREKKKRKRSSLLRRYMTVEEQNRVAALGALLAQRKKAAGLRGQTEIGAGREKVRHGSCRVRERAKPASRRTGRPRWSPPDLEVVQGLAERALTDDQIALSLGVCRATLSRRMRNDEDFAGAIKTGRARALAFVAGKLVEQIQKGNLRAAKFCLRYVFGWGEDRPEHVHGWSCIATEQKKKIAELSLLTIDERIGYRAILIQAEQRMQEAGARVPDDGLDEWGNLKERASS